jgi:hypothetical protein
MVECQEDHRGCQRDICRGVLMDAVGIKDDEKQGLNEENQIDANRDKTPDQEVV